MNYPDDCCGSSSNLPWNAPEATECPLCGCELIEDEMGRIFCSDIDCEFDEWEDL